MSIIIPAKIDSANQQVCGLAEGDKIPGDAVDTSSMTLSPDSVDSPFIDKLISPDAGNIIVDKDGLYAPKTDAGSLVPGDGSGSITNNGGHLEVNIDAIISKDAGNIIFNKDGLYADTAEIVSSDPGNQLRVGNDGKLLVPTIAPANVSDQYVDMQAGDDGNDGSQAHPLKTIPEAVSRIRKANVNAPFNIWLQHGQTFRMLRQSPYTGSITQLNFCTYGDPKYGTLTSEADYWPELAEDAQRATVVFDTYVDETTGRTLNEGLGGPTSISFDGVNVTCLASAGNMIGGGARMYVEGTLSFTGGTITFGPNAYWLAAPRSVLFRQNTITLDPSVSHMFAPDFFPSAVYFPWETGVPQTSFTGRPSFTTQGANVYSAIKAIANSSGDGGTTNFTDGTVDMKTKSTFGFSMGWDLFTPPKQPVHGS